jgi:hypothetical protein
MRGLKSAGDADGLKITGIPATNAVYASTFRVANYADVFDASSDLSTPIGLHMARDGSHLYACSQNGNLIVYSMSTSFLPSTASYQGSYNSVGLTSKWDVEFNETGTRMFVQDIVSSVESVKVFSLSVPWRPDTGTVTLLSTYNLGVSETDSTPTTGGSIQFSNNGRSFYYHPYASKSGNSSEGPSQKAGQSYSVPSNSGVVYYWTLSTAYDLSSKTYQGYKRVPHHSYPSFGVTEDGKWLINGAYNSRNVFYYAIQTAWDITSINSADEVYIDHGTYASSSSSAGQIASSWVGDNYYTIDYDNRLIQKFPWGPALTTAATPGYIPVGYQIATTNSGGQIDTEYWTDINSMTADQSLGDGEAYYAVSTDDRTTWSVAKGSDGVRPIVRDNSGTWQYNSNGGTLTGYDISSPTYTSKTLAINTYLTGPQSFTWGNNGAVLFVCGQSNDKVFGFNLSTAYDLSTATVQSASGFSVGGQSAVPRGVLFNENGTKLYVLSALSSVASGGSVENKIYEYSMSTAYDSTTLSYVATYDFTSHHTNAFDMTWNGDGTKFYTVEQNSNLAHTFSLTTAYDMSTASYVSGATRLLPTNVTGLHFNSDGTVLFFSQHSSVLQYNLTTAYDITTSSDSGTSWNGFTSQGDTAQAVIFNNDGTRLYILSSYTDSVYEYDTSFIGFDTNTTWTNSTTNDEFYALQQALGATEFNRMDKTQLDAVADGSHFTLGDSLDLMIALYMGSNGTSPTSDGVSINYDAQALNQGAVLGTDYDYDFPDSTTVRVTSNAAQNLKIRVV